MTTITRAQFESFETLILTEQLTAAEITAVLTANPEFDEWYRARAAERRTLREGRAS